MVQRVHHTWFGVVWYAVRGQSPLGFYVWWVWSASVWGFMGGAPLSLSLVGVPRSSGPGSAFPSSILCRSAVQVLVLVSCMGWVVLVNSFCTGYEFHESLDSFLGSD